MNINKEILDAFEIIIKNFSASLAFDVTRSARVIKALPNNIYVISLDGIEYEIKSNFIFQPNETVNVLIKQNDIKNLYLLPNS